MKRLLANNSGDIFYLGHVFRHEEAGAFHSPEFTMAEWYRLGFSMQEMIEETLLFILDTLNNSKREIQQITYRALFEELCGFNPHTIHFSELQKRTRELLQIRGIDFDFDSTQQSSIDDLLHLLVSFIIEPSLKERDAIVILTDFPETQAALAKKRIEKEGYRVSDRFEIYVDGVEVANGYHELADPREQKARFDRENRLRQEYGKEPYPIDLQFIEALEKKGLPECSGVAVGFDRLLMIAWQEAKIGNTVPISWDRS